MSGKGRKLCKHHLIAGRELYSDYVREKKAFIAVCILVLLWTTFRILSWKQNFAVLLKRDFSVADGFVLMDTIVVKGELLIPVALFYISKILDGESSQWIIRRRNRMAIFNISLIKTMVCALVFALIGTVGTGVTGQISCSSVCNWDQVRSVFQMETGYIMEGKIPGIETVALAFFASAVLTYFWWGELLCVLQNYISNRLVSYGVCIGILLLRIGLRDSIGVWGISYTQWKKFDVIQLLKILVSALAIYVVGLKGIKKKNFL